MVMGVGGFLLLDKNPMIDSFFKHREEVIYFDDLNDLIKKAKFWKKERAAREQIGKNAQKKMLAAHTYSHRAAFIIDVLSKFGIK
jgi:spore maturation protein CgeB